MLAAPDEDGVCLKIVGIVDIRSCCSARKTSPSFGSLGAQTANALRSIRPLDTMRTRWGITTSGGELITLQHGPLIRRFATSSLTRDFDIATGLAEAADNEIQ